MTEGVKGTILIVEDEESVRTPLRGFLKSKGYAVEEADSLKTAEQGFRKNPPDAVVMDFSLPDGNGLTLIRSLKALDSSVPVVMLTGHGTIDLAVAAIKEGAEQFFTKPVELPALLVVIERALANQRVRHASLARKSTDARRAVDPFQGESPVIRRLASQAARVVSSSIPILVRGETGTGKGVLARWLHENGPRSDEAFVDLNCAGLSKDLLESELFGHEKGAFTGAVAAKSGLLEMAHRGTVFLDEIGEIDIQVQPKLLKVIEELRFRRLGDVRDRQVDVRLVAATHRDLAHLVEEQKFREDLFYRIKGIPLVVPPLRERGRDVVLLARTLLERMGVEMARPGLRLSGAAEKSIEAHSWPGNIRQLRNVLEHAALMADHTTLEAEDLGEDLSTATRPTTDRMTLEALEGRHIEAILREEQWVIPRACAVLGVSRSALYHKIKKHGIALRRSAT
jgi:DNA-binding NtrC family response regulator